jgi:hypothetical protein
MNADLVSFQEGRWSDVCVTLAAQAARGCGASHGLYVQRFSELIDAKISGLPASVRATAIAQAERWDYLSAERRAKVPMELADGGCCSHGLEPDCCPMGCGDL